MLPSEHRLRRRSDFKRVYSKGKSFVSELVVLYVAPSRECGTRIGFAASKKLGGAVVRNRTKRVMREAVRAYVDRLSPGYDMVIVGRRRTAESKSTEVGAALGRALERSGALRPRDG
jgi:ribonuclease P protein component